MSESTPDYSVRIPYAVMDVYEDELHDWMDANTVWGSEDGISNYRLSFKQPEEFTLFLLKWNHIVERL